jgi:hypothetical protein
MTKRTFQNYLTSVTLQDVFSYDNQQRLSQSTLHCKPPIFGQKYVEYLKALIEE